MTWDSATITWLWFIVGILLMVSEAYVPALVVIFFGAGAVVVALARWIGLIEGWIASFSVWLISSLFLTITLRRIIRKLFPPDTSYQSAYEDIHAYGTVVDVVETVFDHNNEGRIRYQGSTWPAMCHRGTIPSGEKAKLLGRNNIGWIVEPYQEEDAVNIDLREG